MTRDELIELLAKALCRRYAEAINAGDIDDYVLRLWGAHKGEVAAMLAALDKAGLAVVEMKHDDVRGSIHIDVIVGEQFTDVVGVAVNPVNFPAGRTDKEAGDSR